MEKGKAREDFDVEMINGTSNKTNRVDQKSDSKENLPWVEKYRPTHLEDVVSHKDIIQTIEKFISVNRLPHLLFYGPPGTGKTSTILAIARQLYQNSMSFKNNVLELNASDERGIDVVREQIKNFASARMVFSSGFKLIILDEADQMTQAAQSALRRVIEQYTKNVRFSIQSRCTKFRFGPLELPEIRRRIDHVAHSEDVTISEEGKKALLSLCKGDMRRVLNVMQACHSGYGKVDEDAVYECTGSPHPKLIEEIVSSMMNEEFQTSYKRIQDIKMNYGLALQDIISGVYDFLRTVVFERAAQAYILDQLSQIEYRLSMGGTEKVQLSSLLGSFKIAVEINSKTSK
ncbi:replication factor C subunit 3/5 [Phakopsora pachyrhizi]|uniref:Replication factor C subunit 3 n=1 Tax=Phakopsora pachyrhizi TaxID=170000 RepID=A0AAV0B338_PHAPC|nr:replication factor C subunit 3/5 [Phakopsora pachyrhizi]